MSRGLERRGVGEVGLVVEEERRRVEVGHKLI
jgi:hypothetical protein